MGNTMLFLRHNIYVHCIHRILAHNFFGKLGVQLYSLDSCMKGGGSNIFIVIIVLCIYTYPAARINPWLKLLKENHSETICALQNWNCPIIIVPVGRVVSWCFYLEGSTVPTWKDVESDSTYTRLIIQTSICNHNDVSKGNPLFGKNCWII